MHQWLNALVEAKRIEPPKASSPIPSTVEATKENLRNSDNLPQGIDDSAKYAALKLSTPVNPTLSNSGTVRNWGWVSCR